MTSLCNSTSYVDLLGIQSGLERIAGESAPDFADRLARAAVLDRGAQYSGLMNEIMLQLGLELREAIRMHGEFPVRVDLAGVHVGLNSVPLVEQDPDGFWRWRKLSEVVQDLNDLEHLCELLIEDGPAFQLCRQSNTLQATGEVIDGDLAILQHPGVLPGTERFSVPVPEYEFQNTDPISGRDLPSVIRFSRPVTPGTKISYWYRVFDFRLIASPVFLMSLTDPALSAIASDSGGQLMYQMREYVQEVMERDRSYWTR